MDEVWHLLKWIWTVIFAVYALMQFIASRRLVGERKEHSQTVMIAMFVVLMVSDWVRQVFEVPRASRIATLAVGLCASVATAVLARLLAEQKLESESGVSRSSILKADS
jgi:hypothetical protein